MSDNTKIENPSPELKDDALDEVSGGVFDRVEHERCQRCNDRFPVYDLLGGYCSKCLDELHKQGVYPPL